MSQNPYLSRAPVSAPRGDNLADVLERVLDKGLVIAGDIQLNLLDIEVLTIKVRLLLASADTAQQMGIDWWRQDPFLSSEAREEARELEERAQALERTNAELMERLERLEAQLPAGDDGEAAASQEQEDE
ncbi:gas vesicle protein GvpJ [Egicoccus sp. AB-alg2]|uniref:gas vesicle protein n=1 Tax=Egicoccus sp. AB-alg2 TaxID=3242693 RepID=UPI00359E65F0